MISTRQKKFRDVQDDINNAQQTGVISAEQAKDKRVAAYKAEEGAIDSLIKVSGRRCQFQTEHGLSR